MKAPFLSMLLRNIFIAAIVIVSAGSALAQPSFSITRANNNDLPEDGNTSFRFVITRSGSAGDLSVTFAVTGTASASDYSCSIPLSVVGSQLQGTFTFLSSMTSSNIFIDPVDDTLVEADETVTLTLQASGSYTIGTASATGRIDDDDSVVSIVPLAPIAYEEGEARGSFLIKRVGTNSNQIDVNFSLNGTATHGSSADYTLHYQNGTAVTSPITLAQGSDTRVLEVWPNDDSIPEATELVTLKLLSGNYQIDPNNSQATVSIIDNDPVVSITATDTNASESGKSGLFTVTRTADVSFPLTVLYTISGTASNGVDYGYLSNSVVIPGGESSATITVAPLFDYLVEGGETVTLTLVTNGNAYTLPTTNTNATVVITDFDDSTRRPPVLGGALAANARYGLFLRGSGNSANYYTLLFPVDFQQGVPLDATGGNATTLFPSNPWTTNFNHYNATNPSSPITFANPLAAFGSRVGGSPLYFGQRYTFGAYAGQPSYSSTNNLTNALRIQVYDQSSMALTGTINVVIPDISNTNEWMAFLSNGYTKTVTAYGLTTILSFNNFDFTWGQNVDLNASYHITHVGSATNKFVYMVELAGGTDQGWLAKAQDGSRAWSRLYTLEFEDRPAWRTLLLQTPQFVGVPIPPGYIGRSVEELLTNNPPVTNVVNATPSSYTNLDLSPELRRSPLLDQFVADMGNDPLLLANYVINEIELTDAISYNDNGVISETSVNLGGVNRGAHATFLEGQGSPAEQCALLVYLLRKANVPATYVFPPHNGLQLVDGRLSKLLRTQVRNAMDNVGNLYTTNTLIPVNYPWVAAYIGTNWIHIFPWLKDTEVEEGWKLYDYMPSQYDNALKWARAYALGDTNLLSLDPFDDSPLSIYPKFIEKSLRENAPGLSIDDIGIRAWNRRHYYSRWSDLPTPTSVTNANIVIVESFGSSSITNVSPALTNIFNTVTVEISSAANPANKVSSGELRVAELLNRRLVAWHTNKNTTNYVLTLALAPFRSNITQTTTFAAAKLYDAQDTNVLLTLTTNTTFGPSDDQLIVTIGHRRHRALPGNFTKPSYWTPYLGFSETIATTNTVYTMSKGDLAAICLDAGCVTRKMLDQHAQEIWNMEKAGVAGSTDKYQGSIAYLMGMSYYEKSDKFTALATRLHKAQPIANFSSGIAMLRADRDSNGQLLSGDPVFVQPVLDMFSKEVAAIGNQSVHLNSGDDGYNNDDRVFEVGLVAWSALEHNVLNRFYKLSDSVSTVRLLQLAQSSTNKVIALTRYNYLTEGEKVPALATNKLKDADVGIWASITNFFTSAYVSNNVQVLITPGSLRNPTRSFYGVGALLYSPGDYAALIGSGLNGGYAEKLDPTVLASATLPDASVKIADDNTVFLDSDALNKQGGNSVVVATGNAVSNPDVDAFTSAISGTTEFSQPQQQANAITDDLLEMGNDTVKNDVTQQYDTKPLAKTVAPTSAESVADPVNAVTGEFYIDAVDLSLNGPMPLQVRRNYSSHNVFDDDFGYGWKCSYLPYLSVSIASTKTLIYAAEPDGTVVTYHRQKSGANYINKWIPLPSDNPRLQNRLGSIANLFNGSITMTTNSGVLTYTLNAPNGDTRVYTTNSFALGSVKRTRPYLNTWQDSRGNFFKFYYGTNSSTGDFGKVRRIEASNGNFLGFSYDIYGHITEAFTGDGRRLSYSYDDFGDLIKVVLPDASEIQYDYLHDVFASTPDRQIFSTHLILRERKPEGRLLLNDFDTQRRVINQYATVGTDGRLVRNASFAYSNNFTFASSHTNFVTGYTRVTDYLTNVIRYDYSNSLVTRILDPLNRETRQLWYRDNETNAPAYARGLKQTVDPRGLVTDFKFDSKGNITNVTTTGDLTGSGLTNEVAVITYSYNTNALPTKIVDPVGNQTIYTYTNPLSLFLRTSSENYASNNTLIAATVLDYYNVTNAAPVGNTLGAYGLLRSVTRAFGSSDAASNIFTCDARGFVTAEMRFTGTGDPAVSNSFFYNLRGQLVERVDAAGRITRQSYNPRGDVEWRDILDEQTNLVSRESFYYNQNGELTWTDGPRSGPEDYVWRDYDAAGRKTQEVRYRTRARADGSGVEAETGDDLFATTFYEYDPFNNLVKVIDPRGNYARMFYDAAGQLRRRLFFDGSVSSNATPLATEGFAYEPGGKVAFSTNAVGGVTEVQYTWVGQKKYQKQPTGATNAWRYYVDGRLKRSVQSNGSYSDVVYDDANRRVTVTFYAVSGTPLSTNISELDRRGNVIRTVDAAGFSFTNKFDGLDRLKSWSGPVVSDTSTNTPPGPGGTLVSVQQAITNFYDAAGKAFTNVNAAGEKAITLFDVLGRVTRVESRNSTNGLIRETDTFYFPDFHSYTVTEGASSTNPIITRHFTDTSGNDVLSLRYPSASLIEFAIQTYDAVGNRTQRRTYSYQSGTTTLWTTNGWTYDALNRVATASDRDGASSSFAYDAAGDLTNRVMPGGLVWRGEYNAAQQLLREYNLGSGNAGARTNAYSYFASTSPFAGLLQTRTNSLGVVCTYGYDEWLRATTNTHVGSLPDQNLTTTWRFDVRGLLTNVTETFASTNTAPPTVVKRSYDAYAQLKNESVTVGTNVISSADQAWNSAARRASLGYFGAFGFTYSWRADGMLDAVNSTVGGASYRYDTAGQLTNRSVGARTTAVTSRDGTGRPLGIATTIGGLAKLTETLAWTPDGLLSTHTMAREDFTDSRGYSYASATRRLAEERLNINSTTRWTNSFAFDNGASASAGVLTQIGGSSTATPASWSGGVDALSRVSTETNSVVVRPASGRVNGRATLTGTLDGSPVSIRTFGTNAQLWSANLELTSGAHELRINAAHPSGAYTASATNWFTNSIAGETATDTYDNAGFITQRLWRTASGATNRVQTLTWDARGRLARVSDRDTNQTGRDWKATYDAFGRRIQTTETNITNSVAFAQPNVVTHYFDPRAEFLEVAVVENGTTTWKLLGPDANGRYGGLNGVGGFEALVSTATGSFSPTLSDALGNIHGVYDQQHSSLTWNSSRVAGYGSVPLYRPLTLGTSGSLAEKFAWRNRAIDAPGLVWLGGNWYDRVAGHFMAFDPRGHDSSISGYSFANGDPINFFDPDGRCAVSGRAPSLDWWRGSPLNSAYAARMQAAINDAIVASGGIPGYSVAYDNRTLSEKAQSFADEAIWNTSARKEAFREIMNPDFQSVAGVATFGVAVISFTANTIDAAVNTLPLIGGLKATGEMAVKEVIKGVGEAFAKDAAKEFIETGTKEAVGVATKETVAATAKTEATTNPSRLLTAGTDVPNAGGVIRSFAQQGDQIYYRVFSESEQGRFLTAVPPSSSAFAREALALPPGNQATYIQEVLVPSGTILQRSRALPAFGARGGAEQFELLQRIPKENFGPGTLLQ